MASSWRLRAITASMTWSNRFGLRCRLRQRPGGDRPRTRPSPRGISHGREVPAQLDDGGQLSALGPGTTDGLGGRFVDREHACHHEAVPQAEQAKLPALTFGAVAGEGTCGSEPPGVCVLPSSDRLLALFVRRTISLASIGRLSSALALRCRLGHTSLAVSFLDFGRAAELGLPLLSQLAAMDPTQLWPPGERPRDRHRDP